MISIREGAIATGKAKPTILKAIKSGRLSASKTEKGEWEIDPAELFRVYPAVTAKEAIGLAPTDYQARIKELEETVRKKAKEVDDLTKCSESWETMAHSWRMQSETITKLLTHDKEPGLIKRIFR